MRTDGLCLAIQIWLSYIQLQGHQSKIIFNFLGTWTGDWKHRSYWPGAHFSRVPKTFRARWAIRKTPTRLVYKAGLFIYCEGNKKENNCKVSWIETPSFWRYKVNYVTRNAAKKFRNFRETGPRAELFETGLALIPGYVESNQQVSVIFYPV